MNKPQKKDLEHRVEELEYIIKNTFWMARRYAHGRHTYAPSTVREMYERIIRLGINIQKDYTIMPPDPEEIGGFKLREDYLDDIS